MGIDAGFSPAKFDLCAVDAPRRPGMWSDALNDFFECDIVFPGEFSAGSLKGASAAGIRVATIDSDPMVVRRENRHIANNAKDVYAVLFPARTEITSSQRGRSVTVKDGDFVFANIGEAVAYEQYSPGSLHLFHAPGAMVRDRIPDIDDGVARSFAHVGTHPIFLESARAFCAHSASLGPLEIARITANLIDLLALVLLGADISCSETSVISAHRRRALRLIEKHYADPAFDVERLVAMMGFSDRYMQRIFAASGETGSDVIRNRRIQEAQRLLRGRRASGMMVSQIGYAVGFNDPAHFSRVFRNQTGCAPRDFEADGHAPTSA